MFYGLRWKKTKKIHIPFQTGYFKPVSFRSSQSPAVYGSCLFGGGEDIPRSAPARRVFLGLWTSSPSSCGICSGNQMSLIIVYL